MAVKQSSAGFSEDALKLVSPECYAILLLQPTLKLTEEQNDSLYWEQIKEGIKLTMYIDHKLYPFAFEPVRCNANQMLISMLCNDSRGVCLLLDEGRKNVSVRFEWVLNFGQYNVESKQPLIEISHRQQIVLDSQITMRTSSPLVLTISPPYESTLFMRMAVSTDLEHLARRSDFKTTFMDDHRTKICISERLYAGVYNWYEKAG